MNTAGDRIHYGKGELIFSEGGPGDDAFIIHSGEVDIVKNAGQGSIVLKTLRGGDMFGEMALITSNPRSASAVARGETVLERVTRDSLAERMQADPEFTLQMVRRLAGMVPEAQSRLLSHLGGGEHQNDGAADTRRDREFAPDYLRLEQEGAPALLRWSGLTLVGLLVVIVVWSVFAKTDIAVSGSGRLVTTQANVVVQSYEPGIVREVAVREGDFVHRGQVLLALDATETGADLQASTRQRLSLEAQVKRLEAEQAGLAPLRFSGDAAEESLQRGLWNARRAQYAATLAGHDGEIRSLREELAALRAAAVRQTRELATQRELAALHQGLYEREKEAYQRDGVYRVQYLETRRQLEAAEREADSLQRQAAAAEARLHAREAQRLAFVEDWHARRAAELSDRRNDLARAVAQNSKQTLAGSMIRLTAPVDGWVLSLPHPQAGAIVRSAETLAELVPSGVPLEAEVDIPAKDVAWLKVGDAVNVKLDALSFVRYGWMTGRLRTLSRDALPRTLNEQPGPVYRARIELLQQALVNPPKGFRPMPGMTVTADIRVGKRSIATYLAYPVMRVVEGSLREP